MAERVIAPARMLGRMLPGARWRLTLNNGLAVLTRDGADLSIDYLEMERVETEGALPAKLLLETGGGRHELPWLDGLTAAMAAGEIRRRCAGALGEAFEQAVAGIRLSPEELYGYDIYISNRIFTQWLESVPELMEGMEAARRLYEHRMFRRVRDRDGVKAKWHRCQRLVYGEREEVAERNREFVKSEEERYREFFDGVESRPLTEEQRRAAIVMEDRNLLIAPAGSGKTSAIIGKLGYALEKGYCRPEEVLVLAFNRKAAEELRERAGARLGKAAEGVTVNTFHRFGLEAIAQARQAKPSVAEWTQNLGESTSASKAWRELLTGIQAADGEFGEWMRQMRLYYRWDWQPLSRFKTRNEYDLYLQSIGAKRWNSDHWGAPTIAGEWVKSLEEVAIANWLYEHGVEYDYEADYTAATDTAKYRQYRPDFYYPEAEVYHEHFALDEDGNPPEFFEGYLAGVEWKRALHKEKGTLLIETTSAMFSQGNVFAELERQLRKHGVKIGGKRSGAEVDAKLQEQQINPLYAVMQTFLMHWKSSSRSYADLRKGAAERGGYQKGRAELFLQIMERIRGAYQAKLSGANEVDFEDMLLKAAECLEGGDWRHPYKLVLVDEFQDMSRSRTRLLKGLLEQNPDCCLFAVGDDWQSIYRFAGSDISVMVNFAKEFGVTEQSRLSRTFRSNQGITGVASRFVSRNPLQLKKRVVAEDASTQAVVEVVNCVGREMEERFVERRLEVLEEGGKPVSVMVLARYNRLAPARLDEWQKRYRNVKVEFSTIHRAKGREADYVFVMGMSEGLYGFPSERLNDSLLDLVMPAGESYEHAEERRLFYVALTRARYKVYLLTLRARRSRFVQEILEGGGSSIVESEAAEDGSAGATAEHVECPQCGGALQRRKNTGDGSEFLGCANYPKCRHTARLDKVKIK